MADLAELVEDLDSDAAREHRWRYATAEPHTPGELNGRLITITEAIPWRGVTDADAECAKLYRQWVGKTVIYPAGGFHRDLYIRGVVETVLPGGNPRLFHAVVCCFFYSTEVRYRIPVDILIEWPDPPLRIPNPLLEQEKAANA